MTSPLENGRPSFVPEDIQREFSEYILRHNFLKGLALAPENLLAVGENKRNGVLRAYYSYVRKDDFHSHANISIAEDKRYFNIEIYSDSEQVFVTMDRNGLGISFAKIGEETIEKVDIGYNDSKITYLAYHKYDLVLGEEEVDQLITFSNEDGSKTDPNDPVYIKKYV